MIMNRPYRNGARAVPSRSNSRPLQCVRRLHEVARLLRPGTGALQCYGQVVPRQAFTLIEILLAVAIFAIVLVAINTVFFSALHLRTTTARALDESAPLQQALTLLRRDLLGAVPPGGTLARDFKSGAIGSGLGVANSTAASAGLEIHTSTGVLNDDVPWGDTQKVTYQLREPQDRTRATGKDLIRSVTRNLLPTAEEEPVEQWLMGDVETLEFACYNGTDWRETWDTSLGDSGLPQAIRVRIQLAANRTADIRNRQPLEMLVLLVTRARTNQTQTTEGLQ